MIVSFDTIISVMQVPPFEITLEILNLISAIHQLLGRFEGFPLLIPQPVLRRQNQIRTIQGSLSIEGNTLSLDQVTALFDQKRVLGPKKDIIEVRNAIRLYGEVSSYHPLNIKDFLRVHAVLMKDLTPDAGKFRNEAVGIFKGKKVSHIAPPAHRVPLLMDNLFNFLKQKNDIPDLVRACIFHYETEFIHPFSDGNGRIGRFWQYLILLKFHRVFEFLPVESLVQVQQQGYYQALEKSDKMGNSTAFIVFSLEVIKKALEEFLDQIKPIKPTPESRLIGAKTEFGKKDFSRKDYLKLFKDISTATASRDLAQGVVTGLVAKLGTKAVTRYRFL